MYSDEVLVERREAARRMYIIKFGEDVPDDKWLDGWARDTNSDMSRHIEATMDLTRSQKQIAKAKELFQNIPLLMALCSNSATPAAKAYALGWQREVNEFLEAK